MGTITGTAITHVYHEDIRRNVDFERNIERVVFAGRSREGRSVLEGGGEEGGQKGGGKSMGSKDISKKQHGIGFVRGMFKGRSWKR